VRAETGPYILAFWHSRFVMMPYAYPHDRIAVLVSRHRDAQMMTRVLTRFGFSFAWGSSTAGGTQGLRQALKMIHGGHDLGIAPDGPRGPRRRVKPGIVAVARLSGLPIVPVSFSARPSRRLGSWDRTLLPLPFARGLFLYGEAHRIPRDADETEQERQRLVIEAELDRLSDLADTEVGLRVEDARPAVVT
jgi:lysophospholipid acyltransferase (LPLAT)-like uncharacterized protein